MIPTRELDRATVPGTDEPLRLLQRDTTWEIRVGVNLLMSSRAHGSEEELAERACGRIAHPEARVLVGGLGMGFTLAAALRKLPPTATVVVVELIPAVVAWNRGPVAHLAGRPLDDPRVTVEEGDAAEWIRAKPDAWDAILLDVDNGPNGLTRAANNRLYSPAGLAAAFAALRARGILGVWSVAPDRDFTRRLSRAGFGVEEDVVRARGTRGGRHTLWLARRPTSSPTPPGASAARGNRRP
jgi:spermidine synthase